MLRKTIFGLGIVFTLVAISAFKGKDPDRPRASTVRTIILDAGHGGHDAGAIGSFSKEKDICLAVTLKVGDLMAKELPDVKVLYTRTTDVYPDLHERARFANENRGDLFVSIHVNAAPPKKYTKIVGYKYVTRTRKGKKVKEKVPIRKTFTEPNPAKGTETYIWGAHKNEDKEIALRENAPMMLEENYEEKYGSVDVTSSDFIVLASLKAKQYFRRSATLAMHVEEEFRKVGRASRDVKQRQVGIWVLQATAMPSILIETGYITNLEEEKYLNSEEGQQELARCIVTAIKRYKVELDSSGLGAGSSEDTPPIQNTPPPSPRSANTDMLLPKN